MVECFINKQNAVTFDLLSWASHFYGTVVRSFCDVIPTWVHTSSFCFKSSFWLWNRFDFLSDCRRDIVYAFRFNKYEFIRFYRNSIMIFGNSFGRAISVAAVWLRRSFRPCCSVMTRIIAAAIELVFVLSRFSLFFFSILNKFCSIKRVLPFTLLCWL